MAVKVRRTIAWKARHTHQADQGEATLYQGLVENEGSPFIC